MPEPSAIEGILRSLVEAVEQREAAEPDLPEWEANARVRAVESKLTRLYRDSGSHHGIRVREISADVAAIEIPHGVVGPSAVEVA